MRHVYIALIVLLTALVLIFKFQNLTSVTISLLGISSTLPVSTLVILVYVLGMVTGSALFGLVRSWIHVATRPPDLNTAFIGGMH
jgi:lipopolysaccharide assembly protein A